MIGDRIADVRYGARLSQKQFGEKIGVSRVGVSMYETNRSWPSLDVVILICETFGVSADWLLELPAAREAGGQR